MGKDQIASEIIKAILFVGTGGAGGYAVGQSRAKQRHEEDGGED